MDRLALLCVVSAGLLWGTGGLAGTLLAQRSGVDPLAVAGYRLTVGGGLIVAWHLVTGRWRALLLGAAGLRRAFAVAALAACFQGCYFMAASLTSVGLATFLTLGAAPVLVVVAEALIGRRRPAGRAVVAVVIALAGLALLAGPGDARSVVGVAFALGSATAFAAVTMLGARPVAGAGVVPSTGVAFLAGGLVLLPLAGLVGRTALELELGNLALVLYLGLVPTATAYMLYFVGLRTVASGTAAVIALLEPITAALLGAVLLQEELGRLGVAGAALIVVAVAVTATARDSVATSR